MSLRHSLRSAPDHDPRRHPARRGLTLAELIVALVLHTQGQLALAITTAFLAYEHAASGRAERAAALAGSRLERLRGGVCATAQGVDSADGLTVAWSVAPAGRAALATVRVSWIERGRPLSQRYMSGYPC